MWFFNIVRKYFALRAENKRRAPIEAAIAKAKQKHVKDCHDLAEIQILTEAMRGASADDHCRLLFLVERCERWEVLISQLTAELQQPSPTLVPATQEETRDIVIKNVFA